MNAAMLLIDMQRDFLDAPGLLPPAGPLIDAAAELLAICRNRGIPVIHVRTTVQRSPDNRMPHWKARGDWRCEEGTPGHEPPEPLRPTRGEPMVHKQFFSGFGSGDLEAHLQAARCDTVILAGVHLHACVRTTAMDAYERGLAVWIVDEATGNDDPLHAAITRRYLSQRGVRFASLASLAAMLDAETNASLTTPSGPEQMTHCSPRDHRQVLWQIPMADASAVTQAAEASSRAQRSWRAVSIERRGQFLLDWADRLEHSAAELAGLLVEDVGKPVRMARSEIARSAALLRVTAGLAASPPQGADGSAAHFRYEPLGVVGIVTPWNNPAAIPVGKIAPALLYGNGVVWKPAPAGSRIAQRVLALSRGDGWPENLLVLCLGGSPTACLVAQDSRVDAVTLSGGAAAEYALHEICVRRHIPFQAELGGNNAAIVWEDAEVEDAADRIAQGAFGFAGQRCTANRRVIVAESIRPQFLAAVRAATARMVWGDPRREETTVGPLIGMAKRREFALLLARARTEGLEVLIPHAGQADAQELMGRGAYHPPAIVAAAGANHEIVQEESFAPVLVVQAARTFDEALVLCNGVRQGLVAAVFTRSAELREEFLRQARAGVLKINQATADANAVSPLGGWKASGVGPAEHGPSDREFYTRVQTIYH